MLQTGLTSKYDNVAIKVYPNPTTGIITIETPNYSNNMEIRILNSMGITIKSAQLSNSETHLFNLGGLKSRIVYL